MASTAAAATAATKTTTVQVHRLSNDPTAAWNEISLTQQLIRINTNLPRNAKPPNKIRIVCMSDTHSLTQHIKFDIPDGDIFIHAGDFTSCGSQKDVLDFNNWLGKLPHRHKIVIAGNHELSFDSRFVKSSTNHSEDMAKTCVNTIPSLGHAREKLRDAVRSDTKQFLTNCIYLQDSHVILYGLKFYGTPWQPEFHRWAFNLPRGEKCLEKWNQIPSDTDVLITHTPPIGFGDLVCSGIRAGCVELLETVQKRVQPKYHIFGHIHEGYGVYSDGKTVFINASTCDLSYVPNNLPVVFDICSK